MLTIVRYRPEITGWFTSTRTNNGNQCVEVRFDGDVVHVRDSKFRRDPANRDAAEPVVTVSAREWTAFLDTVISGVATNSELHVVTAADGGATLVHGEMRLTYTPGEWSAFVAGARDGEFDRIPLTA
ncbi:DUF397 domain-containing protein [Nocardia sp. alder85J]|uniref:DUF397 domain-containing protein n=1 Tax=Nocardia sp. alder85J TaxID=2862949 RepID=UPI001CD33680|nr:DUF397 domain-containing protein [Nocardia sp. alder85J]MCX4096497.1 DUF397 domain-containing protein [Nocardia sp. alder85J]